jgi:predicted nucleic acid-binding protein
LRFWDSSALIPLILDEPSSATVRGLMRSDSHIIASHLTPVEITSSLWRRRHHGKLPVGVHLQADAAFAEITRRWSAIAAPEAVEHAIDLLSRHPLRAADSVQLASALIARERFGSLPFVTLDLDPAGAARAEGFVVLP